MFTLLSDANIASQHTSNRLKKIEEMKKKKAFSRAAVGLTRWLKIFTPILQKNLQLGSKKTVFR